MTMKNVCIYIYTYVVYISENIYVYVYVNASIYFIYVYTSGGLYWGQVMRQASEEEGEIRIVRQLNLNLGFRT